MSTETLSSNEHQIKEFFRVLKMDVETYIDGQRELQALGGNRVADKATVLESITSALQKLEEIFLEEEIQMDGKSYIELQTIINGFLNSPEKINHIEFEEFEMIPRILTVVFAKIIKAADDLARIEGGRFGDSV